MSTTIEKKPTTQTTATANTPRKKAAVAPMNPPTAPAVEDTNKAEIEAKKAQEKADIETLKEAKKRNTSIHKSLNSVQSSFTRIAFDLHWILSSSAFKLLGYKNVYDYAAKEHGIAKGTCNNFINIVERFAVRDEAGNVVEQIRPELKDYQSSKLIVLLGVEDAQLTEFSVDMSVREMKKKVKDLNGEADSDTTEEDPATSDADVSGNGKEIIDTTAREVNSYTLTTIYGIEHYKNHIDDFNKMIEETLENKNFEADGKRIEIVVKW